MGSDERVQQAEPATALGGDNFSASACDIRVHVEGFPEMVEAVRAGFGADVEEDTDIRGKGFSKGVEKPAMRVEFFLVFFFHAEYDLTRDDPLLCAFELKVRV